MLKHQTKGSPKIMEVFDLHGVSAHGGANLLIDYSKQIGLPEVIKRNTRTKASWSKHQLPDELLRIILGYALGYERISHMEYMKHDPIIDVGFQASNPSTSNLYRALDRYDSKAKVSELVSVNRHMVHNTVQSDSVVLDLDTTVNTVHGDQEMATKSYNPRYRGRKSFQPLFAFDGKSKVAVHAELRPGSSPSARNIVSFYKDAKANLPSSTASLYLRADKAFASEMFLKALEDDHTKYAIKLRWSPALEKRIERGVKWERIFCDDQETIEIGVVGVALGAWTKHRRVVIIRSRPTRVFQPKLFPEYEWEYDFIVTNIRDWQPIDVWRFYNNRCTSENFIKELKNGFGISAISKHHFYANAADLQLAIIAYNLILGLKQKAPPPYEKYSARRFRRTILSIPAKIVRHARQIRLRLPEYWPHQKAWHTIRYALGFG